MKISKTMREVAANMQIQKNQVVISEAMVNEDNKVLIEHTKVTNHTIIMNGERAAGKTSSMHKEKGHKKRNRLIYHKFISTIHA